MDLDGNPPPAHKEERVSVIALGQQQLSGYKGDNPSAAGDLGNCVPW
jgi:hypothetical protein